MTAAVALGVLALGTIAFAVVALATDLPLAIPGALLAAYAGTLAMVARDEVRRRWNERKEAAMSETPQPVYPEPEPKPEPEQQPQQPEPEQPDEDDDEEGES